MTTIFFNKNNKIILFVLQNTLCFVFLISRIEKVSNFDAKTDQLQALHKIMNFPKIINYSGGIRQCSNGVK